MVTLSVPEMHCASCKASVERALGPVAGTAPLVVDLGARQVRAPGAPDSAPLIAALNRIGFSATPLG